MVTQSRVLKLEYSSEHAQLQNSKDSSQIECSIWFLHQRAISNCRQYCFGLLGLISAVHTYIHIYIFFSSRRVDTAECNAEPPHLTRTTLINGPQEGCYMHVKITRAVNPASLANNVTAQTVDYTDGQGQGQRKRARKQTENEKQRTNVT